MTWYDKYRKYPYLQRRCYKKIAAQQNLLHFSMELRKIASYCGKLCQIAGIWQLFAVRDSYL